MIGGKVLDDERTAFFKAMEADRLLNRWLDDIDAVAGLKPLPVALDEVDNGDGSIERVGR